MKYILQLFLILHFIIIDIAVSKFYINITGKSIYKTRNVLYTEYQLMKGFSPSYFNYKIFVISY